MMEMNILIKKEKPEKIKGELLSLFFTEEETNKIRKTAKGKLYKLVQKTTKNEDFRGKLNETRLLDSRGEVNAKRILLIGLGKEKEINIEKVRKASALTINQAKALKIDGLIVNSFQLKNISSLDIIKALTESLILTNYHFDKYKTEDKEKIQKIKKVVIIHPNPSSKIKEIINEIQTISENVNFARDLTNENSDFINSLEFASLSKKIAKKHNLKCKVINEKQMKKIGMNLILAVGRGSRFPPRLVILEYLGDKKSKKKTALIGKGITFDSGGINLKPTNYIEDMKTDMAGAAVVLATIKTLADLKIKRNVVGVIPLCENMIGGRAYKPGDILVSYSGKSVEIGNTDAEGRLILADALSYTIEKIKPSKIIDIATLTGAITVTFGEYVTGLISNNDALSEKLFSVGEKTYERVWRLPLYDEYKEEMKSEVADIVNTGYKKGRYAGAITAAAFLNKFVRDTHWAHLDIAGSAMYEKSRGYIPKGATGIGVRLLIQFIKEEP